MPKLSVFAVCEKVIIDDAGMASLISLFHRVGVAVQGSPPSNAVAPKEWAVFTSWLWENDDDGKEFDQLLQVFGPNNILFTEVKSKVVMPKDRKILQFRMPQLGLPVGQPGHCTIRLSLMHKGIVVVEPTPILIFIDHQAAKPNASSP
jgi:hypothetical protein